LEFSFSNNFCEAQLRDANSLPDDQTPFVLTSVSQNTFISSERFSPMLAIVVWHFYHMTFDPDIYPINTACIDGRISGELQKHEHPPEK